MTITGMTGAMAATLTVTGATQAAGGSTQILSGAQATVISGTVGTSGQGTYLVAGTFPLSATSVAVGINVAVSGSATTVDFTVAAGSCAIVIPQ